MAGNASSSLTLVFLIILIAAPTSSGLFFPSPYRIPISLCHLLLTGVANLRASRGDHSGAERVRAVAATLDRGAATLDQGSALGLGGMMWSTGWDYFRNYAWGKMNWRELNATVPEKELLRWLTGLTRMESDAERAAWAGLNYQSILRVSNSMLGKLLKEFRQSEALREAVETVQKEVVGGELLRDCLELGSNGFKGLKQGLTVTFQAHLLLQLQLPARPPIFELENVEICINGQCSWRVLTSKSFKKEVAGGELLRDCLGLVSNGFKGLMQGLTVTFHAHLLLQLQLPARPLIFKLENVEIA